VESTAEDINSSGNFREQRARKAPRRIRFLFAYRIVLSAAGIVKQVKLCSEFSYE
jgi:hypothetical protein